MIDLLRVYEEAGPSGYPVEWHREIKGLIREQAGHRCVRCHHPYRVGQHGTGEWSPCDEQCSHEGETRIVRPALGMSMGETFAQLQRRIDEGSYIEARWRILTVHHLNGVKLDCRWWNLAALCQRCHLAIQGKVDIAQTWPWEHSEWFKPYAAGWYAWSYLGENLTREETMRRLDELLALEQIGGPGTASVHRGTPGTPNPTPEEAVR